ncbi:MAG: RDD family protein [bacterium]
MENDRDTQSSTSEQVQYSAGFWSRLVATAIDSLIMLVLLTPLLLFVYGKEYFLGVGGIQGFWDFVINWILPALMVVAFWVYKQATPGKMLFGMQIVDQHTGEKPSLRQLIIRYLAYFPSLIMAGLGFLWIGWDKNKQGWHDKLAGTLVLRKKKLAREQLLFQE